MLLLATSLVTLLAAPTHGGAGAEPIGAACLDCHPDVVRAYRETGMARALEPVGGELLAVLAHLGEVDDPSGFRYGFEVEGTAARLIESWPAAGPAAGPAERIGDAELRLAIGAGIWDRSFAALRGEGLRLAPLEVLTVHGADHRAVLAPAHEQRPGTRFSVAIGGDCLGCHTDRVPAAGYPSDRVPADWTPRGIPCAVCHGAVAEHVAWQEAALAGAQEGPAGGDPVTTSRTMNRTERVSVCARCHLQGDVRLPLSRAAGMPPPGTDLLDRVAYWGAPADTTEIGFVSQVERLVRSRCYTATADWGARALACESCHDPHRPFTDPAERARTRAACADCHGEGHGAPACGRGDDLVPAGADCVTCHMRRTPVFDLSELRIHDHRIVKRPPPPSRFEHIRAKQATTELERFAWPDVAPPLADDPGLALVAYTVMGWGDAALARLDAAPAPEVLALPAYHLARAELLEARELDGMRRGRAADPAHMAEARGACERVLELEPGNVEAGLRIARIDAYLGRGDDALARIEGLVALHPGVAELLRARGLVHLALGDRQAAARDYEAAFELDPGAGEARALADLDAALDEPEAAARWRAAACRLDPSTR